MNVTPRNLREEFKDLLAQHKAKENEAEFQRKRSKVAHLELESKHTTNTMTEIFQDPELLSRISEEASRIMKSNPRASRSRQGHDFIINKKPQAKDVIPKRAISDELAFFYDTLDQVVDKEKEFLNPLAPKERKYVFQEEKDRELEQALAAMQQTNPTDATSIPATATPESEQTPQSEQMPQPEQTIEPSSNAVDLSVSSGETTPAIASDQNVTDDGMQWQLHLPINHVQQQQQQLQTDDSEPIVNEISRLFDDAAYIMNTSPLKTVGSKHLYHLLPRQSEPFSYVYVEDNSLPSTTDSQETQWSGTAVTQDTIITITINQPNDVSRNNQQIELLGSQFLSDIRDSIYCQSDFKSNNDKRNKDPEGKIVNLIDGQKLSPSFIYLNHTFYIDTRHQDTRTAGQYNDIIEQWLRKHSVNIDNFEYTTEPMQRARLEDIALTIQKPFALVHQDKCEHMMIVQDVRLLSSDVHRSLTSSKKKDIFPRTTHVLRYLRLICNMCTVFPATRVTYNDIYSGFSPCFFCTACFEAFHPANSNGDSYTVEEYYGTPGHKTHT